MQSRIWLVVSSVMVWQLGLGVGPSRATDYRFTMVDVPFQHASATAVSGLSGKHTLVGTYLDAGNRDQGFLRLQGRFSTLLNVIPQGINTAGAVVGFYPTAKGSGGFLFADGTFTPLEVPPADPLQGPPTLLTEAEGINEAGVIVGDYRDGFGVFHSFRHAQEQVPPYTTFDPPWPHTGSGATALNNLGTIVGMFFDAQGVLHGYVKDGDTWTRLDAPGAVETELLGINDRGQIVGLADGRAFVYSEGSFAAVNYPEARLTQTTGITNTGVLVGHYIDAQDVHHGFMARPVPGTAQQGRLEAVSTQAVPLRPQPVVCAPGSRQWRCRHAEQ